MKNKKTKSVVGVGLIGLGFMGKMHFDTYAKIKNARVVAICDVDPVKLSGDWSGIAGNIGGAGGRVDLGGIRLYNNPLDLVADDHVQVVDITSPTNEHARHAVMAFDAGKDVICEKPLARTAREAGRVIAAMRKSRKNLYPAHCIRFWPTYAKACEIVRRKTHGRIISACFYRETGTPLGSHKNWLQDADKSGACALDLHIHDTDFIQHCFGIPKSVVSHGAGFGSGRVDHIVTSYSYGSEGLVMAEGAWEHSKGYPFGMHFTITFEGGTLRGNHDTLIFYPRAGGEKRVKVDGGDGYEMELSHFIACVKNGVPSNMVTPKSAMQSIAIVEAEIKSALGGGKRVVVPKV